MLVDIISFIFGIILIDYLCSCKYDNVRIFSRESFTNYMKYVKYFMRRVHDNIKRYL